MIVFSITVNMGDKAVFFRSFFWWECFLLRANMRERLTMLAKGLARMSLHSLTKVVGYASRLQDLFVECKDDPDHLYFINEVGANSTQTVLKSVRSKQSGRG